jgi:hypothetical protein
MASPQPKSDKAASFASRDDVDTQALQMLPPPYFNENGTSSTVEPTDSTVALARARYALGSLRRERNRRKTQVKLARYRTRQLTTSHLKIVRLIHGFKTHAVEDRPCIMALGQRPTQMALHNTADPIEASQMTQRW